MGADIALSKDEVRQICRTPIKARQVAFLVSNGIDHYVDAYGWPVVLRCAIDGTRATRAQKVAAKGWQPGKMARGA